MKGDELDRYNGRTNIDHTINKYVKIGTSLNFTYKSNDKRNSGVYNQALKMTTITHAYLNDGTINATPNPLYAAHCSPLLDDVDGAYQKNIETTRFFGNAYVQISPLKNLIYKSLFAVDRKNERTGLYQDFQSQGRYQSPSNTYISNAQEAKTGYTWQNTLNYNTDFNKSKHDLSVLLGHEMSQTVDETLSVAGTAGKEHYYTSSFYDVTKITSDMNNSSSYTKQSLLSFFGRVNYKFNEKYLLTVTGRTDGSSVLAEGNKWGFFPSAALAWRINDEDFMENTKDWLSSLKLRISAGIAGNAAVNPYQTVATLTSTTPNSVDKIPASMAEDLSWETTQSLDFGLDFGFLDGRINGSVDYYFNKTKDLLYYKSAPATTVYTSVLANVGESSGQGVEVSLNTLAIKQKNFSWDINWSYTHATDKLEKLADGLDRNINGYEALIVGEPVSIYYDYEADGCWNVGEFAQYKNEMAEKGITVKSPVSNYGDPGTLKIVDRNGDGVIDENDKRVYERSPKHIFGMNNTFTYKNWSLGVQVYARLGGYMNYGMNSQLNYESANWGDIDYWTPTNTGAKFPSPGLSSAQQTTYTTYKTALYWEKADYIKIKDINLNYNLPKNVLSKTGIANARVYASLKNFLSWSRVDNYDAERGGSISFPLQKQVVVGLNLQF
jgi:TonB-linked SusC/RagA family outer membrane protein